MHNEKQDIARGAFIFACTSLLAVLPILSLPAYASFQVTQQHVFPKSKPQEAPAYSSKEPVLLEADNVDYDRVNDVVTATGNVSITQGETVMLADELVYDRKQDMVVAKGHVSTLQPSGDVYFADEAALTREMKEGVVRQLSMRFSDNSVAVASGAKKLSENVMELFKAAYTPCNCKDKQGNSQAPFWAIKADHATIDQNAQKIYYDNASFNFYDVPVIYTPYFSNPTPGADNKSGLLIPSYQQSQNLGFMYKQPIYYAIAPDRDLTLTPFFTSKNGLVMAEEYRQQFNSGPLDISGSLTDAPNIDGQGNHAPGHEIRGHIDAKGTFDLSNDYDWGFNIRRATDTTYEQLYGFSPDVLLTSRAYGEAFNLVGDNHRSYASVEGLSFQGLTAQDQSKLIPVVAPLTNFEYESNPGIYNSRYLFSANAMSLYRQSGDESRRLSGTAAWKLPYMTEDGQILEVNTQLRTDLYDVNSVALSDGNHFNGVTGREVPQVSLTWRYPFINRWGTSSLMVEPIVHMIVAPNGGNPDKIPNEDSLLPEFTDSNLFSDDRYAGYDRIESGPRMSYGLRGQAQLYSDKYIDWLFGQEYRLNNDPNFPIANDLTSHFSDYVGRLGLSYDIFHFAYRFRLDKDNFQSNRDELDAGFSYDPVTFGISYLALHDDPILADKKVVNGGASFKFTDEWSWGLSGARDLQLDQTSSVSTNVTYKNECANIAGVVTKDYTHLLDIRPALSFILQVSFKNLE